MHPAQVLIWQITVTDRILRNSRWCFPVTEKLCRSLTLEFICMLLPFQSQPAIAYMLNQQVRIRLIVHKLPVAARAKKEMIIQPMFTPCGTVIR